MGPMTDPFSAGGFDPRLFEKVPLFRELTKVMSWRGGPVNWELAAQTATAIAESAAGEPVTARDAHELSAAVRVAELWLDPVTALGAVEGPVRTLTRGEWTALASSSEGLGVYVEPIAQGMTTALSRSLGGLGLAVEPTPTGGTGGPNPLLAALNAVGALLYGVQVGTIAGHLCGQLLGTYDLGVPTLDPRVVGTVGDNARRFSHDYGFDQAEFRHWLALREVAHRRMFAGVAWLPDHVAGLIRRFAEEAEFDPSAMLEQFGGLDPGAIFGGDPFDPDSLQAALERPDAFRVEPTTAQHAILRRLQALVAFVEGWGDTVLRAAAAGKLTALGRIEEAVQRRRAEKGPGEQFLEQLIGLDLKPADFRLGRAFCDAVIAARGQEGLDRAWQRPEYLPDHAELAEPSRWLVRMAAVELEGQLEDPDDRA